MTTSTISKIRNSSLRYQAKKDPQSWGNLCGVWKNKKIGDVVKWQKNIREEWDRKLPKIK